MKVTLVSLACTVLVLTTIRAEDVDDENYRDTDLDENPEDESTMMMTTEAIVAACKCPRKKKICQNGSAPTFRRNKSSCSDGLKPVCPVENCKIVPTNSDCKCPKKRKVCANGDRPTKRRKRMRCSDKSRPQCPEAWCSRGNKPTTDDLTTNPLDLHNDVITATTMRIPIPFEPALIPVREEEFSTEKHIDPFPFVIETSTASDVLSLDPTSTDKTNTNPSLIEIVTMTVPTEKEMMMTTPEKQFPIKHIDPFPEYHDESFSGTMHEDDTTTASFLSEHGFERGHVFPAIFSEQPDFDTTQITQCLQVR